MRRMISAVLHSRPVEALIALALGIGLVADGWALVFGGFGAVVIAVVVIFWIEGILFE